jgi:hypothetical protein
MHMNAYKVTIVAGNRAHIYSVSARSTATARELALEAFKPRPVRLCLVEEAPSSSAVLESIRDLSNAELLQLEAAGAAYTVPN